MEFSLCRSREGWGPISPSRPVDFTLCFQYGGLVLGSSVVFASFAIFRLLKLKTAPRFPPNIVSTATFGIKMAMAILAMVFAYAEHGLFYGTFPGIDIVSISLTLRLTAVMLAMFLHHQEQFTSRFTSTPLILFWLSSVLVSLVRLRTAYTLGYFTSNTLGAYSLFGSLLTSASLVFLEAQPKADSLFKTDAEVSHDSSDYVSIDERANIFSFLFFSWLSPTVEKGYKSPLKFDDIPKASRHYHPSVAARIFDKNWQHEVSSGFPSLIRAIMRTYWPQLVVVVLFRLATLGSKLLFPVVLSRVIGFVSSYNTPAAEPIENGIFYASAIYFAAFAATLSTQFYSKYVAQLQIKIRSGISTTIYNKAMMLSNDSQQKYTMGEIVTRSSTDIVRIIGFISSSVQNIWAYPTQLVIAFIMIYKELGWSVFVGIIFMVLSSPVSAYFISKLRLHNREIFKQKDKRIKALDELLSSIKIIKLYAWESPFIKKVNAIREGMELHHVRKFGITSTICILVMTIMPFMISFSSFSIYSLFSGDMYGPLNPQKVFVSLTLFELISSPLNGIAALISDFAQAWDSLKRVEEYLTAPEVDKDAVNHRPYDRYSAHASNDDVLVDVNNGSFKWLTTDSDAYLQNINLQCKQNELVAVVGKVGSGKSSLAAAILGDMIKAQGTVSISGRVAYVPQQPWIINATIQDNILFGYEMEPEFYNQVIEACALRADLEMFAAGDQTEVGEKGITLSGGQKARLSLARAVYARADVYILDDPLAAVDPHVSKHLFSKVIGPHGLLGSQARILVTNAVQYLRETDNVVLMCDGRIAEQSDFVSAFGQKGMIYDFVHKYVDESSNDEKYEKDYDTSISASTCSLLETSISNQPITKVNPPRISKSQKIYVAHTEENAADATISQAIGQTISAEVNKTGKVTKDLYQAFLKACGTSNVITVVIVQLIISISSVATSYWLKIWASSNESNDLFTVNHISSSKSVIYYLSIYAVLGMIQALSSSVRSFLIWAKCAISASKSIHHGMLLSVLRSPMSFFDTTPIGRIINRFSNDITTVDFQLPSSIAGIFTLVIDLSSCIVIISMTTPLILALIVPMGIGYRYLQQRFMVNSREVTRLASSKQSPILAHLQATINGAASIRAYRQNGRFIQHNQSILDDSIRTKLHNNNLNWWLAIRIESLADFILFATTALSIASLYFMGYGDAGLVGLSISYAIQLTNKISGSVRSYSNAENAMTNFERIVEYSNLKPEAPGVIEENRPQESWPEHGQIEFKNYSTRYREGLDLVLNDMTFTVQPGQKVGIVGRTGAGKSSLTLALFRIIEAASGQIIIDGKDIAECGLHDLRSKLSIIPQDPVLFAGTVRANLDPFGKYTDQEIWQALEYAHLADYVRTRDGGLDFDVSQGGDNFSVGQRQLVCLARALLKKAKILVLDEATAAIDNETDAIIQESIRREFKDCTVLTIAHRLNTIVDSDMILVVDKGSVSEYDTPQNLIANKMSIFSQMISESANRSEQ